MVKVLLGTNYHQDVFRPWLQDRTAEALQSMQTAGLDAVRVVGELVTTDDEGIRPGDTAKLEDTVRLAREAGLKILSLCWNVVPDRAAEDHPLVGEDGRTYPRANWALFNFMDPELRRLALDCLETTARMLRPYDDTIIHFQPTNEWMLQSTKPYGWNWPTYSGSRGESVAVMFDEHSLRAWREHVGGLPDHWREQVEAVVGPAASAAFPARPEPWTFSPTTLAWVRFRATLIGDFLVEAYHRVKPVAGNMQILSQSSMPTLAWGGSYEESTGGHNTHYWLERGRSCDRIAVNTYGDSSEERPLFGDGDVVVPATFDIWAETARVHGIEGLIVSEIGGWGYGATEDAQRYRVMRNILQAGSAAPEAIYHLLWNDEPQFEPISEQFFGITRYLHLEPKPAYHELRFVMQTLRAAELQRPSDPCLAVVFPQFSLDTGLELAAYDALTARGVSTKSITDAIAEAGGLPLNSRGVVLTGSAQVATAAFLELLLESGLPLLLPATVGRFGIDPEAEREALRERLTGLSTPAVRVADRGAVTTVDGEVRYELGGDLLGVDISDADLPAGAEVLARFTDGSVAVYRWQGRVVSALALGHDDTRTTQEARTALTRDLVDLIATATGTVRPLRIASPEPQRLVLVELGDIVAVINTGDHDQIATVEDRDRRYDIPVGARRFSAVRRSAAPDFVLLSGAGTLAVDGVTLLEVPSSTTVVFDEGLLRVHPGHSTPGALVREARIGDVPLERDVTEHDAFFHGPFPGFPASVELETSTVARATASFEYRERAWPRVSPYPGGPSPWPGWHTVVSSPDRIQVDWQGSVAGDVAIRLVAEDFTAQTTTLLEDRLTGSEGRRTYAHDADVVRSRLRLDVSGADLPEDLVVVVRYLYDDRPLPVRVRPLDGGISRLHVLHPIAYEGCTILDASVSYLSETGWQPVQVTVGARGVHARHLQESEDVIDVRIAEPD
jgi:hypothetical protein